MNYVETFISAENPKYQVLGEIENKERMEMLLEDIQRVVPSSRVRFTMFTDKSSGYTERGFAVIDLPLDSAIRLGRKYGQESILVSNLGLLNLKSLSINPVKKILYGEDALARTAFTKYAGGGAVSYDLDFSMRAIRRMKA